MLRQTQLILNTEDCNIFHSQLISFEELKTLGSNAWVRLSGTTLREIQGRRDGIGNQYYDPINRLIAGFPYKIDVKLDKNIIIFEEQINES